MFRVRQKVVCVDARVTPGKQWFGDPPVEGAVYTVVSCSKSTLKGYAGEDIVTLLEIKNAAQADFGYLASRFRPAVERKTDISIFTAMLREASLKEKA